MAVAFDAFTASGTGTTDRSWTHTPSGTPKAVIVYVIQSNATDEISGVTYGGVAMTEMTGSPNLKSGGEDGAVYGYFLGSSIPTGDQTVTATASGTTAQKIGYAITLTGAADTEVVDVDATINSTSQENPSVTLSLGGRTSFAAIGLYSGQNATTGITELTSWTNRNETTDGTFCFACYTYDTVSTTDVTAGWTQTADDAAAIAVAVSEASAPVSISPGLGSQPVTGRAPTIDWSIGMPDVP